MRADTPFRVFFGPTGVGPGVGANIVAFGKFDGIHVGHRTLLNRAAEAADRLGLCFGVATFERHPYAYLRPSAVPPVLTTLSDKLRIFREAGVHFVVLFGTSPSVLGLPAEAFARAVLKTTMLTQIIVVGGNFRFGAGGTGDINTIRRLSPTTGLGAIEVGPVQVNGQPVSASRIRNLLANGDITTANQLLGRPYSVRGSWGGGPGPRTAMLVPSARAVPAAGTYVARLEVPGESASRLLTARVSVASSQDATHVITTSATDTRSPSRAGPVKVSFLNRLGDEDIDVQHLKRPLTASGTAPARGAGGPHNY